MIFVRQLDKPLFRQVGKPTFRRIGVPYSINPATGEPWVSPRRKNQESIIPRWVKERTDPMRSRFKFEVDEVRHTGTEHPVRVFNLEGLGFTKNEAAEFIRLFTSDDGMAPDPYAMKVKQVDFLIEAFPGETDRLKNFLNLYYSGKKELAEIQDLIDKLSEKPEKLAEFNRIIPTRDRSISSFTLSRDSSENWDLTEEAPKSYCQAVDANDYRAQPRVFNRTSPDKTSHPLFKKFVTAVAEMVEEIMERKNVQSLKMTLHEVRVFAPGAPSPEGPHQDGPRFVLTALSIERNLIEGGHSIVYDGLPCPENICLDIVLKDGHGSFHPDKKGSDIYHHATPIIVANESLVDEHIPKKPSRKTLGLDIEVETVLPPEIPVIVCEDDWLWKFI